MTDSPQELLLARDPAGLAAFVRGGGRISAGSFERLRILVMLGRPRTVVPNLLCFALGYSYTGAPGSGRMALGALLGCLIGFSANLHNTAMDLDEDSRNLPGRVLLLARVGYRPLMVAWAAISAFMMASAIALGRYFTVFMALALVGLHQYSAPPVRSKGRPLLGLWVFAQTVVFPFLFGWTTEPGRMLETLLASIVAALRGSAPPPADAAWQSFRYLGMWFFVTVWFMAKGAFKNVPDFDGDKEAGVRTSATVFRTRRTAAMVATVATVMAYLTLVPLVAVGLERPRVLLSLLWLVPVTLNGVRLVRAEDGKTANGVLKADMLLSSGFIASLLLLVSPGVLSGTMVLAAGLLLWASDALGLDSRRQADATVAVAS
jgi:4-hydroxybenzoate polyprenyltransferase